jgi:transposase
MEQHNTMTIGIDLGDRFSFLAVLNDAGEVVEEQRLVTHTDSFERTFAAIPAARIVIEASTHSRWVSSLLAELGHEVLVANPRRLALIYGQDRKNDKRDAELLARVGRLDPELLCPVWHRSNQAHADLSLVRMRNQLVELRTKLISSVRGMVKSHGQRLPACSTETFHDKVAEHIPELLKAVAASALRTLAQLSEEVRALDRQIESLARARYPETAALRQVAGVGPITALTFVLTLERPERFRHSREVGAYLGLVPRQDQSGDTDKQLRITNAGNVYLRKLLVQCSHYVLGAFGPDTDLRRWGLALAERGGRNAKKRAIVAVARRLAVLLHRLWRSGQVYVPLGYPSVARAA